MEKIGEEFLRMSARHLIYNASDNFCGCFGFFFFSDFLFFNPEIFLHLTHFCYFAKKEKKRMCNCENQENLKKSCKFHISLNSLLRNICFVEQLDFWETVDEEQLQCFCCFLVLTPKDLIFNKKWKFDLLGIPYAAGQGDLCQIFHPWGMNPSWEVHIFQHCRGEREPRCQVTESLSILNISKIFFRFYFLTMLIHEKVLTQFSPLLQSVVLKKSALLVLI